jgi:hypothetical protein
MRLTGFVTVNMLMRIHTHSYTHTLTHTCTHTYAPVQNEEGNTHT